MRLALLCIILACMVWSYHGAPDRLLWFLEAAPVLGGLSILIFTYRVYPLSNFTYGLIAASFIMMLVGAHYTYAEVPLFNWLKDQWSLERNYYDRIGHFMQGVVPAVVLREFLIRASMWHPHHWLMGLFVVAAVVGISAWYEIAEMTASFFVEGATMESFLGLQGDEWDTQKDMVLALAGAVAGLLFLSGLHDGSLKKMHKDTRHEA